MTENLKKFILAVNKDETILSKVEAWKGLDKDEVQEKTILLAKESGFELTAEDFAGGTPELSDDELSDDELASVSGGLTTCICVLWGSGKADDDGQACSCYLLGTGARSDEEFMDRCHCISGGYGKDLHFDWA